MNQSNKTRTKWVYWNICASTALLLSVSLAAAAQGEASAGNITTGARQWANNCARCHEMRDPTEFRDDLWRPIIGHMSIRAGLTGDQTRNVLAFLQSSNHRMATPPEISEIGKSALGGEAVFNQTCVVCHGANGKGTVPGAPDFTSASGPLAKSDDVLIRHILEGFQSPGSPMSMPARGGNPKLTPADLQAALEYIRQTFGR